jgi:hypothetical protein
MTILISFYLFQLSCLACSYFIQAMLPLIISLHIIVSLQHPPQYTELGADQISLFFRVSHYFSITITFP